MIAVLGIKIYVKVKRQKRKLIEMKQKQYQSILKAGGIIAACF